MDFKSFDTAAMNRALQNMMKPQAADDLNDFLENLPQTAGQTVLIAAGIAWAVGAAIGLYTTIETQRLTALRAELKETEALKPTVPVVKDVPVGKADVERFSEDLRRVYGGLGITAQGSALRLSAEKTSYFAQFREAIGHIQNGGTGWRVSVERLCVGRECPRDQLEAFLRINKVTVDKPK